MEDKHKNKLQIEFEVFLKMINSQIESEDKNNLLLESIKETLINFNSKNSITTLTLKQDKNITSNIIFFLALDSQEDFQLVLKIRKDDSPMSYTDETRYLKRLEAKGLVPKQHLNIASESNKIKISIEEFIDASHIPDTDPYNDKYIEDIVRNLAKFHSIEIINFDDYETLILNVKEETASEFKNKNRELIYLDYLINRYTLKSQTRFIQIISEYSAAESELNKKYYEDNQKVFEKIKNFLYAIPECLAEIMKNYSANKYKLVFSHIDIHRLNFFLLGNQIKFIDFEDMSFTVPGFDLANYLIESEYIYDDEKYPYYIHDVNKTSEDFLLKSFNDYISILKNESENDFFDIGLDEIYRLFCLSLIKTVVDFVLMVQDDVYLKNKLDLIMLMGDRISRFYYFFNLLYK